MQEKFLKHNLRKTTHWGSAIQKNEDNPAARTLNGVIYCRVSSREQIEGTSLESQEAACKEYARTHGIQVLRTFIERGESAKVADRTQLIELIDFCRNNKEKVQALLVWKVDRFARNVGDHFNIKATLLKYGVRVISVTEPIDGNPEGKLMETILAGFAQFDNDIRATRTVQGMRRKIQEGIFPWKPPLGYKSPRRDGTKKTTPDEPDQPLFGLLQKAWIEFAKGTYKKSDIQRLMDSWGIQTRSDISMTAQSIDNFFRNRFYAGILIDPWSGDEYAGKHVPLVSQEDFERVQAIMSRRSRSIPHLMERAEFPLRGLARCDRCHQYLTGGFSRGRSKRYAYYSCGNRRCPFRPNYPTQSVHEEFGAFLESIAPKQEIVDLIRKRVLGAADRGEETRKAQIDRRETERTRLEGQVEELIRMRSQRLITDDEFIRLKQRISERILTLADMRVPEPFDLGQAQNELMEITQPLSELRQTWQSIPVGFQRRFNHMVLPVGFVVGESRTAELSLFFRVLGGFRDASSHAVAPTGERLNRLYQAIQAFAGLFKSIREEKKAA